MVRAKERDTVEADRTWEPPGWGRPTGWEEAIPLTISGSKKAIISGRGTAVAAAYQDLRGLTARAISLHESAGQTSFWTAWRGGILVFANVFSPTVHQGIVHELVHAILMEEGYYRPTWGDNTRTRGALSNELQHPEVFRRMEAYGLDMASYWADWESKLEGGLARLRGEESDQPHFHFLQIFTWFFFPAASGRCLEDYRRLNPTVYNTARQAHDEARAIGTSTAEAHRQFLTVFMRHWRRFCNAHLPPNDVGEHVRRLLEESRMECVRDSVNARSEEFIHDYLRPKRLA
jgi:hypothetical protein